MAFSTPVSAGKGESTMIHWQRAQRHVDAFREKVAILCGALVCLWSKIASHSFFHLSLVTSFSLLFSF
jgi:hypothetical protein